MKHLKIVALFAAIVSIEQLSYASSYYNSSKTTQVESGTSQHSPSSYVQFQRDTSTNDWNDAYPNKPGASLQLPVEMTQKYQNIINGWQPNQWKGSYNVKTNDIGKLTKALQEEPEAINVLETLITQNPKEIADILVNVQRSIKLSPQNQTDGSQPANYLYSKKINGSNPAEVADRLIEESYVTPAMQWAILSFFEQPFIYNTKTGAPVIFDKITNNPRDWFTIQEILANVTLSNLSTASKTTTSNALQAAIQAIDIAVEVAKLEAGYDANKQTYYFYQNADKQITESLYRKKLGLEALLARVQNARINGAGEAFTYEVKQPDNKDFMMLSPKQVTELINAADFKTKAEHTAAQLLFKQCFIAQLHHTKSKIRLDEIKIAQHSNEETIYSKFPSMSDLMSIAKEMPTKPEQHALLTDIRKSVQTALYIAKKEYQKVYHLTTHPLVQALKDMDDIVKIDWINKKYGATQEDQDREAMWTNLTNAAIGAGAVVGVIGTGLVAYDAYKDPYKYRQAGEDAQKFTGETVKAGTKYVGETVEAGTKYVGETVESLSQKASNLMDYFIAPTRIENQIKFPIQDTLSKTKELLKPTSSQNSIEVSTPLTEAENQFNALNSFY